MERQIIYHTRSLSHRIIQSTTTRPIRASSLTSPRPCTTLRPASRRSLHTTAPVLMQSKPPKTRDRGPKSDEDTQTDFGALDVLRNTAAPATSIDATTPDGFALNNQMRVSGCGLLLVGGEAFRWRPWVSGEKEDVTGRLKNAKGQWEVREGAWGALELVWPKPGMSQHLFGSMFTRLELWLCCQRNHVMEWFADCLQISSSLAPARTSCPLRPLFAHISMASAYGWRFRTQGMRLRSSICWRPREVCNRLLRR
jgi:NADH dehydrogenase [ubiquinone] 1 alpha subcomplex assembly factor 3